MKRFPQKMIRYDTKISDNDTVSTKIYNLSLTAPPGLKLQ